MKRINRLLLTLAALPMLVVSCDIYDFGEKTEKYVAAEKPDVAEVYFANDLSTSYDLTGNTGTLSIPLNRINTADQLTVSIVSVADAIFTVPSSVSFAAGSDKANIDIKFDPKDLQNGGTYKFQLLAADETSEYGDPSYSFTATLPALWIKWKKGHMTEGFWAEEEDEWMYYQELEDGRRYCYIENCFDTSGEIPAANYYFYWDPETNRVHVPMQYLYTRSSDGLDIYFGDNLAFYEAYYGTDYWAGSTKYSGWEDYVYKNEVNMPYYDGNGGFYLADQFFLVSGGTPTGSGWWDQDPDTFIAQGFVRTTDYNTKFEYKAKYMGEVKSEAFDTEWDEQQLRVYEDVIDKEHEDRLLYYLPGFYTDTTGLAFIADEEAIYLLDNAISTGTKVFGHELFADVKGGTVTWDE
ncbi:MAG: hypothetical protein IJ799_06590, partial [Bacteroidales bacterium]|nr:hypothetical protein [Bacteroidales bacterium]